MTTIKINGLENIKLNMRSLAPRIQKNILAGMTASLARSVRDEAKRTAPREFGSLEDNIIAKRRRGRRGRVRASVIVRDKGKRDDPQNAFYWRFQEFGYFARDGSTWIPGSGFISRAFDSVVARLDSLIAGYVKPRVEKELRRR